ncbi:hypothetical protein M758_11G093600 [Ceratodon purpureus]|nr:hypothetical protein M758_11G093600 [Ceratodon purpureus]
MTLYSKFELLNTYSRWWIAFVLALCFHQRLYPCISLVPLACHLFCILLETIVSIVDWFSIIRGFQVYV